MKDDWFSDEGPEPEAPPEDDDGNPWDESPPRDDEDDDPDYDPRERPRRPRREPHYEGASDPYEGWDLDLIPEDDEL